MQILSILLALSLVLFGCTSAQRSAEGDVREGTGTVRYVDLEGGFYGIVGDDGQQLDPRNLDESFKEDGLRVHFRARIVEDAVSIRMWGRIVNLLSIERL